MDAMSAPCRLVEVVHDPDRAILKQGYLQARWTVSPRGNP